MNGTARFNAVKVFAATLHQDRARLGERVTEWLQAPDQRRIEIVDIVVRQSSDAGFHCVTIAVFYRRPS